MAIVLVSETGAGSTDAQAITTGGIGTSGATMIVVGVISYAVQPEPTLSDSQSNTWTDLTSFETVSQMRARLHYVLSPSTHASAHTFTVSSANNTFPALLVMAFSGVATVSAFDQQTGAVVSGTDTTSTGNVTPSEDNELLVTLGGSNNGTPSVDGYYTPGTGVAFSGSLHWGGRLGYAVQTTATTKDATWTDTGASAIATAIASFKATSGAAFNPGENVGWHARFPERVPRKGNMLPSGTTVIKGPAAQAQAQAFLRQQARQRARRYAFLKAA